MRLGKLPSCGRKTGKQMRRDQALRMAPESNSEAERMGAGGGLPRDLSSLKSSFSFSNDLPRYESPTECTIEDMRRSRWTGISLLAFTPAMGGCDPLFDVGGAFFPGWLLAVFAGFACVMGLRAVLNWLKVSAHLWLPTISYISFFVVCSIGFWLMLFRT